MKILITGCNGQLGSDLMGLLENSHQIDGCDLEHVDITSAGAVDDALDRIKPDMIINSAAYTQVDQCETDREAAWKANAVGPENLARNMKTIGGRLIHISTDYVFDGSREVPQPYVEEDAPNPQTYYGVTKLAGEKAVSQGIDQYMIFRPAWLYGIQGHNFLKTMLRLALTRKDQDIKVVNDQYGSPTWSFRLAKQIEVMLDKNATGIFHATSEGYCTWYELARYFLEKMDVPHRIIPCTTEEYPTPAKRPRNSILENHRLKEMNLNVMAHWKDDIDQFVSRFRERLLDETISE